MGWNKCIAAGEKPAKMLGRSALRFALPEVSSQLLLDISASAAAAKATQEELQCFLEEFEATLVSDSSDPASESSIVWCADLRAALLARQLARKAEAEERVNRQTSADTFSAELKSSLLAQDPSELPSGVQIEEVTESDAVMQAEE